MAVNANDRRPKHRQIADWLIHQVAQGALSPGDRLPSARELMDRFNVSNQTAQNAVKLLQSEGLAEGVPGRGTFLVETIDPESLTTVSDASERSIEYVDLSNKLDMLADELEAVHRRLDQLEATHHDQPKRPAKKS